MARITTRRMLSRSDEATVVMPRRLLELNERRVHGHEPLESRRESRSPVSRRVEEVERVEESGEREHVRNVEELDEESWSSRTRAATPIAKELSVLRTPTSAPKQAAPRYENTPSTPPLARDVPVAAPIAGPPRTTGRKGGTRLGTRLGGVAVIFALGILIGVLASLRTRPAETAAASPSFEAAPEVVPPIALATPAEAATVLELSTPARTDAPKVDPSKLTVKPHHSSSHTHAAAVTPAPKAPPPVVAKRAKVAADPAPAPPSVEPDEALDAANVVDTLAKEQLDSLIQ